MLHVAYHQTCRFCLTLGFSLSTISHPEPYRGILIYKYCVFEFFFISTEGFICSIVLQVCCGYMNIAGLIDFSIVSGLILGFLGFIGTISLADSNDTKNWHFAVTILMVILGIFLFLGSSLYFIDLQYRLPMQTENKTTFQNIYSATCPYGIISVQGSGWGYYYSLNYAEEYSIKIMKGNEVLTYNYDTDSCRVVVDGTFRLETIDVRYYKIDPFDGSRIYCWSDGNVPSYPSDDWQSWKPIIHIPAMPIPRNTTTNWYVGG